MPQWPWSRDRTIFAIRLVLISVLSLYFELTLIRWIPTQVLLLAYFTNFVLIAALLGLGVGMLLATRRIQLALYFPAALLVLSVLVVILEHENLVLPLVSQGDFEWGHFQYLPRTGVFSYLVLVAFFFLMVGVFILIGQEVGRTLRTFRPLAAYALNIFGSLLGVLGFAFLNWLQTPPTVWFIWGSIGFVAYLLLTLDDRRRSFLVSVPLLVTIGLLYSQTLNQPAGVSTYWSPYYQVQTTPFTINGHQVGYSIAVNKDALQFPMNLSGRFNQIARIRSEEHQYNLPYTFIHPKHVLVLGAGTGNDVAAALRNAPGARIDAVEIDPVVASLGHILHPERPYNNPNVHVHVTDARSFLQQTSTKYDLIVFGKLDSHRVFSHMSSVRMDNYVYTLENFQTVRRHLASDGVVSLGFVVHEKWIADRLFTLLVHVFGHTPLVYQTDQLAFDTLFFIGNRHLAIPPGSSTISHAQFVQQVLQGNPNGTWHYSGLQGYVNPSEFSPHSTLLTDDWPYLYMQNRAITSNYLIVLLLTVLASVLLVWLAVPRIDVRSSANWNFLFLGAGFALQETKGITDIALLFGSTWITNIIVISSILLVALVATLVVTRWRDIPLPWMYAALIAVLLFNYLVPLTGLLNYGFWIQVIASGMRVAGPIFFSGIIFARWFQRSENTSSALGANLMGAVVGGLSEYSSLALGLRDLYLLAILFYGLSFAFGFRGPLRRLQTRRDVGLAIKY